MTIATPSRSATTLWRANSFRDRQFPLFLLAMHPGATLAARRFGRYTTPFWHAFRGASGHGCRYRLGCNRVWGVRALCVAAVCSIPGLKLAGMAGTARPAALAAANRFGLENIEPIDAMLAKPGIDIVYIATPPFLHFDQARQALEAGKHVICEKPLALTTSQADELISIAHKKQRLLVANLMQRYNPLFDLVGQLIETRSPRQAAARIFRELRLRRKLAGQNTGFGIRRKAAASSSSTASTSSTCSPVGLARAKSWPPKQANGPERRWKTRCNAPFATATPS